jgi:RNA polymerase sigma-70 factor (ECF subfamily)
MNGQPTVNGNFGRAPRIQWLVIRGQQDRNIPDRARQKSAGSPAPVSPSEVSHEPDHLPVFQEHRSLLFSIAYRMLGSAADAEDLVQESFIRWQETPIAEIESPRAFLITIVSRLCINHLQSARVRREEYFGTWLPEPLITSPAAEPSLVSPYDDSLSLAFLVVLERLNPVERAVFLLREVFDYEYSEIAQILDQKEPACRQILRRARQRIAGGQPRFDPSPQEREKLFQRFLDASARGDLAGLVDLLSDDVVLYADGGGKGRAVPLPIYGVDKVARFFLRAPAKFLPKDLVRRRVGINGQPGVVSFLDGRPFSAFTVDIVDGRIRRIYIVANTEKLSRLPQLPAAIC